MRRTWHLPRASEKDADEAWYTVGDDTPERALADAERWGASWKIWVETEYIPTLEALRAKDMNALLSLAFARNRVPGFES